MSTTEMTHAPTSTTSTPDPRRYWSLAVIALAQLMIVLDSTEALGTW